MFKLLVILFRLDPLFKFNTFMHMEAKNEKTNFKIF